MPSASHDTPEGGDGSEGEGPVSSFQSYSAEGDILAKQGDYRKAIDAYTKALNMRPAEKNCLVSRSKCYLQLGDADMALYDAESALKEDSGFFKAMYQKAEALYAKGDFEMALVFYHRGNKLRPELEEFRLGIQKAREAIDNSIGDPRDYKFKPPPNFTLDVSKQQKLSAPAPTRRPTGKRPEAQQQGVVMNTALNKTRKVASGGTISPVAPPERDVKQLLGELHADKEYLEQFQNDRDFIDNPNDRISELVVDALKYLDTRAEFWRQQKPIYARRKQAQQIRKKMQSARYRQITREKEKLLQDPPTPTSPKHGGGYKVVYTGILDAMDAGKFQKVLELGRMFLGSDLHKNRAEVVLMMGNAALELRMYTEAENRFSQVLGFKDLPPTVSSSALGQLGRTYAKQNKYTQAIKVWETKLATPVNALEKTWMYHDMARCYIELGRHMQARSCAQKSVAFAVEANERNWLLKSQQLMNSL